MASKSAANPGEMHDAGGPGAHQGLSRRPVRDGPLRSPDLIPRGPLAGNPKRPVIERTLHLDLDDIRTTVNAWLFARSRNLDLTVRLTVVWPASHYFQATRNLPATRAKFLRKACRWLRNQGLTPAWVSITENELLGRDGRGIHAHIAFAIPTAELAWALLTHLQSDFDARGIRMSEWYGSPVCRTWAQHRGWMRYSFKRTSPHDFRYRANGDQVFLWSALGITTTASEASDAEGPAITKRERHRAHGRVPGSRVRVAHAIDRSERVANGWRELRSLEELAAALDTGVHPDHAKSPPPPSPLPVLERGPVATTRFQRKRVNATGRNVA